MLLSHAVTLNSHSFSWLEDCNLITAFIQSLGHKSSFAGQSSTIEPFISQVVQVKNCWFWTNTRNQLCNGLLYTDKVTYVLLQNYQLGSNTKLAWWTKCLHGWGDNGVCRANVVVAASLEQVTCSSASYSCLFL